MNRPSPAVARSIRALPSEPGVYRFRDVRDVVLYAGRAARLRERVASYWSDLRERRQLTSMVAAVTRVEAVVCASRHEAAWLERNLLGVELPPWNRTVGGQEVPLYLELDARPAAPGLRVVHLDMRNHRGSRLFGPYLGGLQVRRAAAGLQRIYPLDYTGTGLSGTERAMADERGVEPRNRAALSDAVARVLSREPAAVREARMALQQARAAAAAAEAFKLAARVDAELRGVEWITSPQRLSVPNGGDLDVGGWSAGVLASFTIRSGRLCA